jgi:hypothetical protein
MEAIISKKSVDARWRRQGPAPNDRKRLRVIIASISVETDLKVGLQMNLVA